MKRIILIGVLHDLQRAHKLPSLFARKLTYFVEKARATAIIEEWRHGETGTFGKRIADEKSLSWHNAGTPKLEEFTTNDPQPIWIENELADIVLYGPIDVQIKREEYFLNIIKTVMEDHEVGVFICGLAHLHSMSERLHREGYFVEGYGCTEPAPETLAISEREEPSL